MRLCEYSLSDRNLRILGLILDRVREAQEAGRVLPDPEMTSRGIERYSAIRMATCSFRSSARMASFRKSARTSRLDAAVDCQQGRRRASNLHIKAASGNSSDARLRPPGYSAVAV
jgi:hypothetical protein